MNAIVLAGGFGSRLKPLTDEIPKPMLKIANRPMLSYVVSQLAAHNIYDITFTLGYRPEMIRQYVDAFDKITPSYSIETEPLGTAGGVKKAADFLDDTFVVVSGDALSDIDISKMAEKHFKTGADITMAVTTVDNPTLYGVCRLDENDMVTEFIEKPSDDRYGNLVNTGIYIINKRALSFVPENKMYDFSRDLFPQFINKGLFAYVHDGYWSDIGDKDSYYKANFHLIDGGFYDELFNKYDDENSLMHLNGSLISKQAVTVGDYHNSVIDKGVTIQSGARLENCVVFNDVSVAGQYFNCIVGKDFVVEISKNEQNFYNSNKNMDNLFQYKH